MKKKIPFDISYREKVESGEVSVVTRDDRHVDILRWDANSKRPIVGLVTFHDGSQSSWDFMTDGKNLESHETVSDLFLLVEDDEFTEFEERLGQIIIPSWDITKECEECEGDVDDIRQWAAELLDLAKKQLQPEFDKELEQAYKNQDEVVYRRGYDAGFAAGSEIDEERLTDNIAEKVAERVVKDGNPFAPNPAIPGCPWTTPGRPYEPITVMYGVTPTEFKPMAGNPSVDAFGAATSATTESHKGSDPV